MRDYVLLDHLTFFLVTFDVKGCEYKVFFVSVCILSTHADIHRLKIYSFCRYILWVFLIFEMLVLITL